MSRIISLTNQKGGVGKTTSSVNLAVSFAVSEVKTLLIDLDPQSNATTGIEELIDEPKGSIYDAIIRGSATKDVITKTQLDCLDIITSTSDLVGAEVELVSIMAREHQLEKVLKSIKKKYNYISCIVIKTIYDRHIAYTYRETKLNSLTPKWFSPDTPYRNIIRTL